MKREKNFSIWKVNLIFFRANLIFLSDIFSEELVSKRESMISRQAENIEVGMSKRRLIYALERSILKKFRDTIRLLVSNLLPVGYSTRRNLEFFSKFSPFPYPHCCKNLHPSRKFDHTLI